MHSVTRKIGTLFILIALLLPAAAEASGEPAAASSFALTFLWIVVLLVVAKVASLVERIGQPSVLGELIAGVVLGNLALVGIQTFEPIKTNEFILFLSELGVVILLFQVGLETNIEEMRRVGVRAFLVATVGVVVPFFLGSAIVGPQLLPGLSSNVYIFLGAILTATSVGITARVFRDLGKLQTPEAQIVLGAAVIDDVLGLIILAVVSAIVTVGTASVITIAEITLKAVAFLAGAIVLGKVLAPRLSHFFSRINTGTGMKFTLAIGFGLVTAFLAERIGLAPIVGAFAAGLVLDPVHFRLFENHELVNEINHALKDAEPSLQQRIAQIVKRHEDRHVEELVEPLGYFLVPIFFVLTGMHVRLDALFNGPILVVALGITVAAFVGKVASGLVAGPVNKAIVGFGMIPRGEVGLIFAATGKTLGVVNDEIFSMIVIVVLLSTFLSPPILTFLLKRQATPSAKQKRINELRSQYD
ncbi:MAG: cation:proton antiporter [Chloroflexi bacterium]|nr:cation:proton antiporter [Chloroflexota bacterium]